MIKRSTGIRAIFVIVCAFSTTTLLQSVITAFSINRIAGGLIAAICLGLYVTSLNWQRIVSIAAMALCFALSLASTQNIGIEINDQIYFTVTFMLVGIASNRDDLLELEKAMRSMKRFVGVIVLVNCLILAALILTHTRYKSSWGGDPYFVGLSNTEHTLASVCCLMLVLIYSCSRMFRQKIWCAALSAIPLWAILESGARTFLIPAAVLLLMIVNEVFKKRNQRITIYIVGAAAFAFALVRSSMFSKFLFTLNEIYTSSKLAGLTSGRVEFWLADLEAYASGNFLQWLLGRSFSYVYQVNELKTSMYIWAHNDIIYLLVGTGLVGATVYLNELRRLFQTMKEFVATRTEFLLCLAYLFLPMMVNGFFVYQHFVYSFILLCAALSINDVRLPDAADSVGADPAEDNEMDPDEPLVTVMMSCYNERIDELEESVRSMLNQTLRNIEVFIVNDNPENVELTRALEKIAATDERVRWWVNAENIGLARTMNEIASKSKAKYLAKMDADDVSLPERLEAEYERITKDQADVVYSDAAAIDEHGDVIGDALSAGSERLRHMLKYGNVIIHSTVLMRRESFLKVGGYRNFPCSQDYDLWVRMVHSEAKFSYLPRKLIKYRMRFSGITASKGYLQMVIAWYISELHSEFERKGSDTHSAEKFDAYLKKYGVFDASVIRKWESGMELVGKSKDMMKKKRPLSGARLLLAAYVQCPLLIRKHLRKMMLEALKRFGA